jgi:EKC/KEOPS complex subunit CGI121/TPRKB
VDVFQVQTAASRALLCHASDKLTTKTLHAELVFNLSGSRNVAESFRRFGIADNSTSLLVCAFDADEEQLKESLHGLIEGTPTGVQELNKHLQPSDIKNLKRYYKIQDQELTCSTLLEAVVCRIATKSCQK